MFAQHQDPDQESLKKFSSSKLSLYSKFIAAIGARGSGKTTIIIHLLQMMKRCGKIHVFSGSEESDPTYSQYIPRARREEFVHFRVNEESMSKVVDELRNDAKQFRHALKSVSKMFKNGAPGYFRQDMEKLNRKVDKYRQELCKQHKMWVLPKVEQLEFDARLTIYRKFLTYYLTSSGHVDAAKSHDLKRLYANPYSIVLFDDMSFQRSEWKKWPCILYLAENGRHDFITFFLCLQYAVAIAPALRSNIDFLFLPMACGNLNKVYENYLSDTYSSKKRFLNVYKDNTWRTGDEGCSLAIGMTLPVHEEIQKLFALVTPKRQLIKFKLIIE